MKVTVEQAIRCSPEEFLEFVMDIERYAEVDDKLGPFDWSRRDGNSLEFKFQAVFPGLPGPGPKMVAQGRLTPGRRIDVCLAPLPQNKLLHRVMEFGASFAVESIGGGTQVRRTFGIEFKPPLRWLAEPYLRRNLPRAMDSEIQGAKAYLERGKESD